MRKRIVLILFSLGLAADASGILRDSEFALVRARLAELEGVAVDPLVHPAPPTAQEELDGRPRLAIARSIESFAAHFDTLTPGSEPATLALLSMARQHANLGLHEDALGWYRRAALSGEAGSYSGIIESERLRTIVAVADSAAMLETLASLATPARAERYAAEGAALLQTLRARPPSRALGIELRRMESLGDALPSEIRLELARHRTREGAYAEALSHWRALLSQSAALGDRVVALTLRGIADSCYLLGERADAERLYELFRSHDAGRLSAWGSFQLGALASARGEHRTAIELYRSLCQRDDDTPWRDEACWRQLQAERLVEIDEALAAYGRSLSGR